LRLFGSLREVVLPSEGDIDDLTSKLFDSFGVEVVNVPFSLESARASFLRTIHKIPPSDTSQQFKDIWRSILNANRRSRAS
jgi:hypothetical protein